MLNKCIFLFVHTIILKTSNVLYIINKIITDDIFSKIACICLARYNLKKFNYYFAIHTGYFYIKNISPFC